LNSGDIKSLGKNDGETSAQDVEKNKEMNKMAILHVDKVPPIPKDANKDANGKIA